MKKITISEVGQLLRETYSVLGNANYQPNNEDILTWMNLFDENKDEQIEYLDYEKFIIIMLEKSGINLYK